MRNVFFGTSDFAATVLEALLGSRHAPSLVVTRPPRPKGRGKKLQDPPVALLAQGSGIPLYQPESVNEPSAAQRISDESPAALTVCAFGAIIKEPLLSLAPSFNVHPSLLPRWRGAAPIERAIQAGDLQTGVTIMQLSSELDAGPICAQRALAIEHSDDYGSLAPRLARIGGEMLVDALDRADAGSLDWIEQLAGRSEEEITYAEKIEREDRMLRPRESAASELALTVRALNPHVGAFLMTMAGSPLRVVRADVVEDELGPGEVTARDGRLFVGTRNRALELLELQPAGGRPMDVESYLRGNDPPEVV